MKIQLTLSAALYALLSGQGVVQGHFLLAPAVHLPGKEPT